MTIQEMKQTKFKEATLAEWEQVAIKSLKGKSLDSLSTKTLEEIILKPLYSLADMQEISNYQTDKVRSAKQTSEWLIAQQATGKTSEDILEDIKDSLAKGNNIIHYKLETHHQWDNAQLEELSTLLQQHPVLLDISVDPIFIHKFKTIKGAVKGAGNTEVPNTRTLYLDGTSIHQAGGDAVSELVSVLLQADNMAQKNSIEKITEKAFVQFSVDTNFFMEIAKIRAFRILWKAFGEAQGQEDINAIPVHTETSLRSFSALDATVNILRAANSTLAAVLGGADIVTSHPHDILTNANPTSKRIARNMQLVLKEETHIQRVIDASGGSYYIETLTKQLVEKAWALFLELMKENSIESAEAKLNERVAYKWEEQLDALATRKKSLIGTNVYANPDDSLIFKLNESGYKRLAEPFEQLRQAFLNNPLKTAIFPYGLLKEYKARMDFISGYLTCIGLTTTVAPENLKPFDLQKWIDENEIDYGVFVGNDEQTAGLIPALLNENISIPLDVAGKSEEYEDWLEAGLNGRIFAGQSLFEKGFELLALAKKEVSNDNA
ncbi:methylmalonyl-CoA mutase family protein [Psychrobacillus antarcticus]|uniref:methylmalonyl-CoA mutase family protein n=1 Tax=Psychrobacillus antarcticus TaxID=2879115 RepID=UPI0024087C27|nr:methylmalonyl-CoA mutase family protein [Psychrobacillus antarcticus]